MADDADWANDMAEREREALIQRIQRRLPPPRPARSPARMDHVLDDPQEGR